MPRRLVGVVELQLRSYTSVLDGGECLASRSGRLYLLEKALSPLYSRTEGGWDQNPYWKVLEKKKICFPTPSPPPTPGF